MIDTALLLLRSELTNYFISIGDPVDVVLENIGLLETSNADNLNNRVLISLVNIEEESTLKNGKIASSGFDRMARYINLPVHLNLYVLFTANFPGGTPPQNGYVDALSKLSGIIRFFQGRSQFSVSESTKPFPGMDGNTPPDPDILNMKINLELYTLTFEQVNHLWGTLGGRQIPFVLYKLRLVLITERRVIREVPLIEEIETNLNPMNNR